MKFSMIVLIVLLALVAAFAVQNPGIIKVRFLNFSGDTSLLVVIVVGFGAGVLGGWLAGLPGYFRRRSEAGAAARRIRELEAEVSDLKRKSGGQPPMAPQGTP
ncbi:MAG: LapA family protein [Actinomycetota bacterium]